MKNKLLFASMLGLLLAFVGVPQAQAQSIFAIFGQVTDASGNAMAGHDVHIASDSSSSLFFYMNTVTTNANGYYGDTITGFGPGNQIFFVGTQDCNGGYQSQTVMNNQGSSTVATADFQLCFNGGSSSNCASLFYAYPDSSGGYYFANASTGGGALSYSWDFGDGNTSTLQHPNHTYSAPGLYLACLTVSDGSGCTDTYCDSVYVANPASCSASFYASQQGGQVWFSNQSSGTGLSYDWDFGDGNSSTSAFPSHTYAAGGTYIVCLTISNASGCSDTYCDSVSVASSSSCSAAFYAYPDSSTGGNGFYFYDASTGTGLSYSWDFGDGTTSSSQWPSHTFAASGVYNVCLTVSNSSGCSDTYCSTVTVQGGGNPSGNLWGYVMAGNNFVDEGWVWLIEFDSAGNTLTAVDSVVIDSGMYMFQNVVGNHYLIKAALEPTSAYYANWLPTYYGNQLFWDMATMTGPTALGGPQSIMLVGGNNPGGPGFIGGNVWQGANKTAGEGDPVGGVQILLLDATDNPIAHTVSDANGEYEFSNIAYGTYKVWAEVWGKTTTPNGVTISAQNETANGINIVIGETEVTTSIAIVDRARSTSLAVYPNPIAERAVVSVEVAQAAQLQVAFYNAVGQRVLAVNEQVAPGTNTIDIDTQTLPEGVYVVMISSDNGLNLTRKVVKAR